MAELIADCAEIPAHLSTAHESIPLPAPAARWTVTDACRNQVRDIEDY